ncbi:MAG TPA: hypothetical protein VID93_05445 [Acidimicrobiales bacterium]
MLAAITAVALGTIAMVAFAAGNHRWDGAVLISFTGSHGVHVSDLLGLIPFAAGVALGVWCLRGREGR